MKTINKFLIAFFVTVFSVTSFSQVINFDVDNLTSTKYDTVDIGDNISFTNRTNADVTFKINNDLFEDITNGDMIGPVINILVTNRIIVKYLNRTLYEIIVRMPTTAGVNDLSKFNLNIFPNPTTDFLNISGNQIEALQVFDVNGRLVLSETPNATNINLDVRSLETGFYTVLVNDQQTIRFIKE